MARDHPSFTDHLFGSALVVVNNDTGKANGDGAGLQLDLQGNVYVGAKYLLADHQAPPGYENDPSYGYAVGSVIKFPKEGGQCFAIAGEPPAGKNGLVLKRQVWPKSRILAENAMAVYPRLGIIGGSLGGDCSCRHTTFSVDGYGRLTIPNAYTFTFRMVDNAGNEIMEVGKYGNIDSIVAPLKAVQDALPANDPLKKVQITPARPENVNALLKARPLPDSDAFFGWPEAVAVSERAVYVADIYNHCIVRLDKRYACDDTLEMK